MNKSAKAALALAMYPFQRTALEAHPGAAERVIMEYDPALSASALGMSSEQLEAHGGRSIQRNEQALLRDMQEQQARLGIYTVGGWEEVQGTLAEMYQMREEPSQAFLRAEQEAIERARCGAGQGASSASSKGRAAYTALQASQARTAVERVEKNERESKAVRDRRRARDEQLRWPTFKVSDTIKPTEVGEWFLGLEGVDAFIEKIDKELKWLYGLTWSAKKDISKKMSSLSQELAQPSNIQSALSAGLRESSPTMTAEPPNATG